MRVYFAIIQASLNLLILFGSDLGAEWRFETFLGKSSTCKSDLNIKQPSEQNDLLFDHIEYNDKSFQTPLYYGLRTSYFTHASSNLGLEAEFIHAKIYSKSEQMVYVSGKRNGEPIDSIIRFGEMVQGFSMTHGLNFLFFNLVGRFGFVKNKIVLYGRTGIGPSIPHVESVINGKRQEGYELHGPAYQLAGGTGVNVWKKLGLILEYKLTLVKVKNAKIPWGHASTDLKTNHWVFGLSKEF